MNYLRQYGTKQTPQSEPILGSSQVENSAGGFAWEVDKWTRLRRWLILGSEGGSYYATERKLTMQNIDALTECLNEDGPRTVIEITKVSVGGRAPKNDQAIFALAVAASYADELTRTMALLDVSNVCRTGTHLFQFCTYVQQFRGWGRALRTAVGNWYTEKDPKQLAYQVVKYRQRDGWTHRDVLRRAHPKASTDEHRAIFDWVTHGTNPGPKVELIDGFEYLQAEELSTRDVAALVTRYGLPREAIPSDALRDSHVWAAMLPTMPLTALIRNLGVMTANGLLTPTSSAVGTVVGKLSSSELLHKARIHPLSILMAQAVYASGGGYRGKLTWSPVTAIVDALDSAFYLAFNNVESSNKRWLIGLDISPSMGMGGGVGGTMLTPRQAAAAMALVTVAREPACETVAFAGTSNAWRTGFTAHSRTGLQPFPISPRQRLTDVIRETERISGFYAATDCALPMLYAMEQEREVDVFAIYTDSETWFGDVHPVQALQMYRKQSGIDAKLIVVGMVANEFSIADPNDQGMMDVVGFDSSAPALMSAFARGEL